MGMSASQARYLSLIAQQSNLEYQGQQINQERSILSQQVSELYNSLLAMDVPTPPSTQDFTTVQYQGTNGATKYTFDASDVKPGKDGGYSVSLGYTAYGHSLSRNNGYAVTSQGYEDVQGRRFSAADTRSGEQTRTVKGYGVNEEDPETAPGSFFVIQQIKPSGTYYVMSEDGTGLVPGGKGYVDNEVGPYYVVETDPTKYDPDTCVTTSGQKDISVTTDTAPSVTITQRDLENLYEMDPTTGVITKAEAGVDYIIDGTTGAVTLIGNNDFFLAGQGTDTAKKGSDNGYKIGGYAAMTMAEYKASFDEKTMETYNGFVEAIKNSGLKDSQGNAYTEEDFMVYIDDDGQPHFALASDVKDNDTCVTYNYIANGEYTKRDTHDNAKLTFDPSSGRITSVDIPVTDSEGNVVSWTTIPLEATTVTDENAYNDAYAKYEYAQYEYDKKQQEINAKTEVIQQQDRNLELRLQRLDTQRTQITTELEAIEKVMNDNIESSYKSFSG